MNINYLKKKNGFLIVLSFYFLISCSENIDSLNYRGIKKSYPNLMMGESNQGEELLINYFNTGTDEIMGDIYSFYPDSSLKNYYFCNRINGELVYLLQFDEFGRVSLSNGQTIILSKKRITKDSIDLYIDLPKLKSFTNFVSLRKIDYSGKIITLLEDSSLNMTLFYGLRLKSNDSCFILNSKFFGKEYLQKDSIILFNNDLLNVNPRTSSFE